MSCEELIWFRILYPYHFVLILELLRDSLLNRYHGIVIYVLPLTWMVDVDEKLVDLHFLIESVHFLNLHLLFLQLIIIRTVVITIMSLNLSLD
jgi:hypothetical protein